MNEIMLQEFESIVRQEGKIIIIDFYAPWCGPCRALAPKLEILAKEYKGKAEFYKVNVDNASIVGDFRITSVPTVLIFQDGEAKVRFSGGVSEGEIRVALDHLILSE